MPIGQHVQMGVIPHGRPSIHHRERRRPGLSGIDLGVRAAVIFRGNVHPMPVSGGDFPEFVGYVEHNILIAFHDQSGTEKRTVVAGSRRETAKAEIHRPTLHRKVEGRSSQRGRNQ